MTKRTARLSDKEKPIRAISVIQSGIKRRLVKISSTNGIQDRTEKLCQMLLQNYTDSKPSFESLQFQ